MYLSFRNAGRLSGASGTGGILVFSRGMGVFIPLIEALALALDNFLGCCEA